MVEDRLRTEIVALVSRGIAGLHAVMQEVLHLGRTQVLLQTEHVKSPLCVAVQNTCAVNVQLPEQLHCGPWWVARIGIAVAAAVLVHAATAGPVRDVRTVVARAVVVVLADQGEHPGGRVEGRGTETDTVKAWIREGAGTAFAQIRH